LRWSGYVTNKDKAEFATLMTGLAEVCANAQITKEKIDIYFQFLQDLDIETVRANAKYYVAHNKSQKGFFPPVAFLRDPRDPADIEAAEQAEAQRAFDKIQYYLSEFYYPEFHGASLNAIHQKMTRSNEAHLFPMLQLWGTEIQTGNTQVARAQFLKAYTAEKRNYEFKRKEIGTNHNVQQLLNDVVNKLEAKQ
jgi:hypothetical protein